MTAIERTAYPRIKKSNYRKSDLFVYVPTEAEVAYTNANNLKSDFQRLNFILQLKLFQKLGYFPELKQVPLVIVDTVSKHLNIEKHAGIGYGKSKTKYRHRNIIRNYLSINNNNEARDKLIIEIAEETSKMMNDPANIINAVIEAVIDKSYELPSFSYLDRTVNHIRHTINQNIFITIHKRIKRSRKIKVLIKTLTKRNDQNTSDYDRFKSLPKKPTISNFKELVNHHNWLKTFGDFTKHLKNISKIKIAQFAQEARSLDSAKIKAIRNENKKFSLIACMLAQSQRDTKDALGLTFCRCIHGAEKSAISQHEDVKTTNESTFKSVTELLLGITEEYLNNNKNKNHLVQQIESHYAEYGGAEKAINDCDKILSKDNNKHFHLIWNNYKIKSKCVVSFLESIDLGAIKEDDAILKAVDMVIQQRKSNNKEEWISYSKKVDMSFAPKSWLPLITKKDYKTINARHFECCVMKQLRDKLLSSDVYIKDSDAYGDYRQDLIPWSECNDLLPEFCELIGIPNTAINMVSMLKNKLKHKSKEVDKLYPTLDDFSIDIDGVPTIKKNKTNTDYQSIVIRKEIKRRMPERKLLDILCLSHNTTEWASCFAQASSKRSNVDDKIGAAIVTTFCYGSGMGPSETARHVHAGFNARTIAAFNKKHVNMKKLNSALAKVVNFYQGFPIIKNWGSGVSVSVDGTLEKIYDQNLLSEAHFRYGKKGGIAYHHISDTYIALFSSLIPCGVWEAIAIIDGLLENESNMQPKQVHGDTQAQSTPVFALSYLFGIQLFPRIRNWKGLKLFKADKRMKFKHINSLFKDTINWGIIEKYWKDMMQIVLSIQHGKISSKAILSKLNSRNKSSKLYQAFQELGNVVRTLFLLDYISDPVFRKKISAETNKVESYNNLSDWTRFASDLIIASNNVTEMEKAIKYNTLLNNMIILQNVIDMSRVIQQMRLDGWSVRKKDLTALSPYLTEHLKRFGEFVLDLSVFDAHVDKIKSAPLFV